jgi:hypothetical protein
VNTELPADAVDVPGQTGYKITPRGEVFSCWSKGGDVRRVPTHMTDRWRALRPGKAAKYYPIIGTVHTKKPTLYVHRLVALVFIGPPPFDGAEVRHKDGNPANNHASNLEYGTHHDNMLDIDKHGRRRRGENVPMAKTTNQQVLEMVSLCNQGMRQKDVAKKYGVSPITVSRIVTGRKWQSVTGIGTRSTEEAE